LTVLQALAMAEGVLGTAAKNRARIIRKAPDGTQTEIPVDLKKVFAGKSPDEVLAANDILFVPNSTAKSAMKRGTEAAIGTVSGLIIWRR
jgi:polysaccharide export outer membrane protein